MRLLQKSCFVIPEVVIGNPVSLKNKDFWIPVFTGMTAQVVLQGLLQEPHYVLFTQLLHCIHSMICEYKVGPRAFHGCQEFHDNLHFIYPPEFCGSLDH